MNESAGTRSAPGTNNTPSGSDFERSRKRLIVGLGVAAIAFAGFAFLRGAPSTISFVKLGVPSAIVLIACGIAAMIGGLLGARIVAIIVGIMLLGAAILQLFQLNAAANVLGGNASTMALLGAFGVGLFSCGLLASQDPE